MDRSPHIQQLLGSIADKLRADQAALAIIVRHVLNAPESRFQRVDVDGFNGGPDIYPLPRTELPRFMRMAGLERWHTSTWLRFNAAGRLGSDAPFDTPRPSPEADARLDRLSQKLWANCSLSMPRMFINGSPCYLFNARELVGLLTHARDICRQSTEWAITGPRLVAPGAAGSARAADAPAVPGAFDTPDAPEQPNVPPSPYAKDISQPKPSAQRRSRP